MRVRLRLTGRQHAGLHGHLYPGDGLEAAALALCGRRRGEPHVLTVHELHLIPHDVCGREPDLLTWPTDGLEELLSRAEARGLALLKLHSHPGGHPEFSALDDAADRSLFGSVHAWLDDGLPHASVVMLPDGRMLGRVVGADGSFAPLDRILVAGDDIHVWDGEEPGRELAAAALKMAQAFGRATTELLARLSVAVVGASGTGGPVVEQLARLGVGELVLVDPDVVEEKNLNRIPNTTLDDAREAAPKVLVLERAVLAMGLGTRVTALKAPLQDPEVVRRVTGCDVVIGCLDSVDGRHVLNRLASHYLLPYLDIGVRLDADGKGGVDYVGFVLNYLQPDGPSLLSRGLYTLEQYGTAALARSAPEEYERRRKEKYIVGATEDRPGVVAINTAAASHAVLELLARLHPYRLSPNAEYAETTFVHSDGAIAHRAESEVGGPCPVISPHAGRGDVEPLLGMPELSD